MALKKNTKIVLFIAGFAVIAGGTYLAYNYFRKKEEGNEEEGGYKFPENINKCTYSDGSEGLIVDGKCVSVNTLAKQCRMSGGVWQNYKCVKSR
jgi:hypothetical protein